MEPVGTTPDPKALDAKLAEMREANDAWLTRLGKGTWIVAFIIAGIAVVVTAHNNWGPSQGRALDRLADVGLAAVRDVEDAPTAAPGQTASPAAGAGLSDSPTRSSSAAASNTARADSVQELRRVQSDLQAPIEALPATWSGESLRQERAELTELRTELGRAVDDLDTAASGKDTTDAANKVRMTLTELKQVDVAPGFTLPWDYDDQAAAGFVHAIFFTLILLGALSLLSRRSGGMRSLLIGGDGRFSTSQTQAALWTLAVLFLASDLLLRRTPGEFDALDENYLLLLGGPYAAWVISGAVGRGKLQAGDLQKVTTPEAQVKDVLSDDNGRASLTDTQFFAFSILALVGVLVAFAREPARLPEINPGLVLLSSAAALVYTGKKALDNNAPVVSSITRESGAGPMVPGDRIVVSGTNLVPAGAAAISTRSRTPSSGSLRAARLTTSLCRSSSRRGRWRPA